MRIPLSWLKEQIDISAKPEHIAHTLTLLGLEVDHILYGDLGFKDVIVARIDRLTPHPEIENLRIATLFDGQREHSVVTNAANAKVGMKTAYAKVGASLPGNVMIKEKNFKGVRSEGALLSHEQLGLSPHLYGVMGGIMEFASHIKEGVDVASLFAEAILEISLTPNLIHAASVRGIARELAAIHEVPLLPLSYKVLESSNHRISDFIHVEVKNQEACPRYCCRVIDKVIVGPSPDWLKKRLEDAGVRSINNVVDITNYVMIELGHPLHAFDIRKIAGKTICVRNANAGESIVTLDHQKRELTQEMLVIASKTQPLAIAGVMGSLDSEVTADTTTIVLEAAYFTPTGIRKTSTTSGLQTAASYRFERGTDRANLHQVLDRAAALIQTVCNGEVMQGIFDSHPSPYVPPSISLRIERISKLLGINLSANEVHSLLRRLEMITVQEDVHTIIVRPPSYRHDMRYEIDLIEEVARLYGYQKLVGKKKSFFRISALPSSSAYLFESKVRDLLLKCNLQEVINCDLISPKEAAILSETTEKESMISLLNPSSLDHSILRISLLPGLLSTVRRNIDHGVDEMKLFEVGRVHVQNEGRYLEPLMAALLIMGNREPIYWQQKGELVDFYDLKGIIEVFLHEMQVQDLAFTASSFPHFHPGRQAHILSKGLRLGVLGEIHPALLQKFDISQSLFFAELNLDEVRLHSNGFKKMQPLPLYPASKRDWTIALAKNFPIDTIFSLIKKRGSSLLESVSLIDVYENEKLGKDTVNATFRFCYRDLQRTLSLQEIEKEHENMVTMISKEIR